MGTPRHARIADEGLSREVYLVAAVVIVGVIMSILDTTIVNVALEVLSRELDASLNTIQWVSTGYLLALASVIPLTGWMSERFGAKRVYMTSVALFGAGSALCGLAWSAESLIGFRILQGLGGGMIMPVGMSLMAQVAGRLDLRGLLLLSPGLAAIVFGLSKSESHGGFTAPIVWIPIVGGALLVAAFVLHSLRVDRPLLDMRLFGNPVFSAAAATTFLVGAALFGAMILLPLYYQIDRGESALTAGLLMAPQGVGAALAMPIAGRLTDRFGGGPVVVVGLVLATLGTLPFVMVSATSSYALLGGILVLRGVGIGCSMMPAMASAYAVLTGPQVPRATSALNVVQRVGGSLGTALLAVVLQREIRDAVAAGPGGGQVTLQRIPAAARQRVAEPIATAFAHTFWWAAGMTVLALVPATVLVVASRRSRRDTQAPEEEVGPIQAAA